MRWVLRCPAEEVGGVCNEKKYLSSAPMTAVAASTPSFHRLRLVSDRIEPEEQHKHRREQSRRMIGVCGDSKRQARGPQEE